LLLWKRKPFLPSNAVFLFSRPLWADGHGKQAHALVERRILTVRNSIPFWIVVLLSVACAMADYWLKRASELTHPFRSGAFVTGVVVYMFSAFGWAATREFARKCIQGARERTGFAR
jgi:hypothetical protein